MVVAVAAASVVPDSCLSFDASLEEVVGLSIGLIDLICSVLTLFLAFSEVINLDHMAAVVVAAVAVVVA